MKVANRKRSLCVCVSLCHENCPVAASAIRGGVSRF